MCRQFIQMNTLLEWLLCTVIMFLSFYNVDNVKVNTYIWPWHFQGHICIILYRTSIGYTLTFVIWDVRHTQWKALMIYFSERLIGKYVSGQVHCDLDLCSFD
jgi:uncharacterized integral membrane protein